MSGTNGRLVLRRTIATVTIATGTLVLLAGALVQAPLVRGGGAGTTVSIEDFAFRPQILTVYEGESVTWINDDSVDHTVTSVGYAPQPTPTPTPMPPATPFPTIEPSPQPGELFDFVLAPGQSATFTFPGPGRYDYFCRLHPSMTGSIRVAQGTRPTASPTPTPPESPLVTPLASTLPDASAAAPPDASNDVLTALGLAVLLIGLLGTLPLRRRA